MKVCKSSDWKCCATCRHWGGNRKPDGFYKFVEYDTSDKGQCFNGAFSLGTTNSDGMCWKWEQQYKR